MATLVDLAYRYALLLVLLVMVGMLAVAYLDRPDRGPSTEAIVGLVSTVLAIARQSMAGPVPRKLPGVIRGLAARLRVRRQIGHAHQELDRIRAELHDERRARGLEQLQLRDAHARLSEIQQIDRIGRVVAELEAAAAQLIATLPEPRQRTRRKPAEPPPQPPPSSGTYTD